MWEGGGALSFNILYSVASVRYFGISAILVSSQIRLLWTGPSFHTTLPRACLCPDTEPLSFLCQDICPNSSLSLSCICPPSVLLVFRLYPTSSKPLPLSQGCLGPASISALIPSLPCLYLCPASISALPLSLPCIYLCPASIFALHLSMPCLLSCLSLLPYF